MNQPMLHVVRYFNSGSERDAHRIRVYELMIEICQINDSDDLFLDACSAARLLEATEEFLMHYNVLTCMSMDRDMRVYNQVFKHHLMWHISWMGKFQSPKAFATDAFEDFIGRVQRCAKACVASTRMDEVGNRVLENYTVLLQVRRNRAKGMCL